MRFTNFGFAVQRKGFTNRSMTDIISGCTRMKFAYFEDGRHPLQQLSNAKQIQDNLYIIGYNELFLQSLRFYVIRAWKVLNLYFDKKR